MQNSVSITNEVVELLSIFEESIQISCLARRPNPDISEYFARLIQQNKLTSVGFKWVYQHQKPMDWHFLPDVMGKQALIDDMTLLIDIYRELLDCPRIGLRLEVLDSAMCPRFHVDKVGIRLLCTYRGVGTQWLDDRQANRTKLGIGAKGLADECSGLIVRDNAVGQAEPFDIVLLKGALWPNNEMKGAIHRSPVVDGGDKPRVLLALDALWD